MNSKGLLINRFNYILLKKKIVYILRWGRAFARPSWLARNERTRKCFCSIESERNLNELNASYMFGHVRLGISGHTYTKYTKYAYFTAKDVVEFLKKCDWFSLFLAFTWWSDHVSLRRPHGLNAWCRQFPKNSTASLVYSNHSPGDLCTSSQALLKTKYRLLLGKELLIDFFWVCRS